ncbi:MAG: VanW family protein [Lachnospiraceae bacterium]
MAKRRTIGKRMSTRRRKRAAVIGGLVCAICLLIFGCSYIALYKHVNAIDKNTICKNIYIGTVDVSGLTEKQAKQAIETQIEEKRKQTLILKVAKKKQTVATLGELGLNIEQTKHLTQQAVNYGKKGGVWSRYHAMTKLKQEKKVFKTRYILNDKMATTVLEERVIPLEKRAVNAGIQRVQDKFVYTDESKGKTVDIKASIKKIETYLNGKWNGKEGSLLLVSEEETPKITKESLTSIQDILGTFSTNAGSGERVQNLRRGAELINGTILMPGDEYSVSEGTRPYDEENGYVEAGAYENGKVVSSIAGGVCQVSTTLYNAILLSELEVTQRQPHSMLVNYVEPSMDAAIAGDYKDLKFKNNLETPVYIEGYISEEGRLTFVVYGKETRDVNRTIEYKSETLETKESVKKYEEDHDAPLGSWVSEGEAHTGKEARLWKIVYENGTEVSKDVINNSSYDVSNATVKVGTKSENAEAVTSIRTAIASQDGQKIETAIANLKAE